MSEFIASLVFLWATFGTLVFFEAVAGRRIIGVPFVSVRTFQRPLKTPKGAAA